MQSFSKRHSSLKYYKMPVLVFVVALLCMLPASPAQADPHAVFYTTTGQQQLFFNILAALDQADYVEPATPALGLSTGNSREELLQKRAGTGFGPETDTRATSTKTELSSLVTRAVTLEGNDVWTTYLLHQFALEAARRNATEEVTRVYCNRGLGLVKCQEKESQEGVSIEDQKKEAFIVNPIERNADANYLAVTGILESSYDTGSRYQVLADNLRKTKPSPEYKDLKNPPLPFDLSLANLKAKNAASSAKSRIIDQGTEIARRVLGGAPGVDESALDSLNVSNDGDVSLATSSNESSSKFIDRYMDTLGGLLDLPNAAISVGAQGRSIAKTYLATTASDGAVADTKTEGVNLPENPVVTVGREATVNVPAHAKVAITASAVDTLPRQEGSLISAPAEAESIPGKTELVNRDGSTRGATTTNDQTQSNATSLIQQVAGDTSTPDISDATEYHDPKQPLSPNTNPVQFHHEEGSENFLLALGYDVGEQGCGCEAHSYISSYARNILTAIENDSN